MIRETLAQPNNHCYMEDINGSWIDLSNLCGGNSSSPASTRQSNSRSFQVEIKRREQDVPVVDVLLNGSKTYEMLVDTGASGTVLTSKMAEELGLESEGKVSASTASSTSVEFQTTTIESIKLGEGEIRDVKVAVSPTLEIGLLGQDFFSKYDVTIKQDKIEFKL